MRHDVTLAVARRDLALAAGQRSVILPMTIVPIVIITALPAVIAWAITASGEGFAVIARSILDRMPAAGTAHVPGLAPQEQFIVVLLGQYTAPLFLVLPLMVASVIAADSFAGEKERNTLETLLHSPVSDGELITGKVLACWIPAVIVAGGGFLLYIVTANAASLATVGVTVVPTATWWVLILWAVPAVTTLGLGATVLVSSRVSTTQAANQLAPAVVLPLVALLFGQLFGVVSLTPGVTLLVGLAVWLLAGLLLAVGVRLFGRSQQIAVLGE